MFDYTGSQIWNACTAILVMLLSFRTATAFSRFWEGTGLLHQMRGEWFDTVSNCVTFSIAAKKQKPREVTEFRHTLVRLMSLCHGSSLEEIAGDQIKLESIDVFGLDDGTLNHLRECHDVHGFNKVEVMLHLIQSLITRALDQGVMKIPAPIASRVYQTISRGFVNLLNAKKITDTRFPFPYAQLITFLMFLHIILTPMIISGIMKSKVLCAVFSFIPIFGMFSLTFIASELENPFGTDDNDLPLAHFQEEMNNCLMMLLHTNTDMIASTSQRCVCDFYDLLKTMNANSGEHGHSRLSGFQPALTCSDEDASSYVRSQDPTASDTASEAARSYARRVHEEVAREDQAARTMDHPSDIRMTRGSVDSAAPFGGRVAPVAPATPVDLVLAPVPTDPQSRLLMNMEDFAGSLTNWTKLLDTNTQQMGGRFDALHAQSQNLASLLKGSGSGWEAAVSPVA